MRHLKLIELTEICKFYQGRQVLNAIELDIYPGDFLSLLGANGAGKSTLLRILAGQILVDSGKGHILDVDLHHDLSKEKEKMALVTEDFEFNLNIPLNKMVDIYASCFKNWDNQFFLKLINEQMLSLDREFMTYSRGQRMQILLCLSLAKKPKLIFIDEVTSVLDVKARKYFIHHLEEFAQNGGAVIMTTNIISEIQNSANKCIILEAGKKTLNIDLCEIPNMYLKIRKTSEISNHEIFNWPNVYWVGTNSDGTDSYIVEKASLNKKRIDPTFLDKRKITLEEIFMFTAYKRKIDYK